MAKMHVIMKALFLTLGVYVISIILRGFNLYINLTPLNINFNTWMHYFLILLFGVLIYQFIVRPDKWAMKIVGKVIIDADSDFFQFTVSVYRITMVFCGIFCIYLTISTIEPFVIDNVIYRGIFGYCLNMSDAVLLVLAIYFLFGAPHFVRWQSDRTFRYLKEKQTKYSNNPC